MEFFPHELGAGDRLDVEPVDVFVCRRGPVLAKWLPLAYRLAAPGAVLVGIHPTGDPVAEWNDELPEALRFGRGFDYDEVRGWVTSALGGADGAWLHGCWWFDVPERFDDPAELHARLTRRTGSYDDVRSELEALFSRHGGSVDIRHRRLVWRVDFT